MITLTDGLNLVGQVRLVLGDAYEVFGYPSYPKPDTHLLVELPEETMLDKVYLHIRLGSQNVILTAPTGTVRPFSYAEHLAGRARRVLADHLLAAEVCRCLAD